MIENFSIKMKQMPSTINFPFIRPFYIAQTPVTYESWMQIYSWASINGYTFENQGNIGSNNSGDIKQPVTALSWRDAVVACNAMTEYYNSINNANLKCVYQLENKIIRDSRNSNSYACSNIITNFDADGFRLPTSKEWELAARYINEETLTPEDYASGAGNGYQDKEATMKVAWYEDNSKGTTQAVGLLAPNSLGLYDMAGNVWEWCQDTYGVSHRIARGGSCYDIAFVLQSSFFISCDPDYAHNSFGFRPIRTNII